MYTYGNWTSKEEMPSTTKAFVYLLTDIYNKKYIGVKTLRRQWRTYTSSSKTVNEAISNGMIFTFEILYFFIHTFAFFIKKVYNIKRIIIILYFYIQ